MNEVVDYRPSTDFEKRRAFTNPGPTPSNSPVVSQTDPATTASAAPELTQHQKEQLIQKFSVESGLNFKWSLDCLNANNWNYNLAAVDFQRAKVSSYTVSFLLLTDHQVLSFRMLEIFPQMPTQHNRF